MSPIVASTTCRVVWRSDVSRCVVAQPRAPGLVGHDRSFACIRFGELADGTSGAHGVGMTTIHFSTNNSLEDLALALAEGEHEYGDDVTAAGAMLIGWTGADCPWFVAGPTPCGSLGIEIASFDGLDVVG